MRSSPPSSMILHTRFRQRNNSCHYIPLFMVFSRGLLAINASCQLKDRGDVLTFMRIRNADGKAVTVGLTLALFGCAIYRPQAALDLNSLPQLRTQSAGRVRISAAVLTAEESRRVFGVPVCDSGVQPVWLSIENQDTVPYALLSGSIDQNRFSPLAG
jgi:hypothetical protein